MTTSNDWGSDVRISQPEPVDSDTPILVDLGGFAFTTNGITHNINSVQAEEIFSPTYAPPFRGKDTA